jgi:hypothetical protein
MRIMKITTTMINFFSWHILITNSPLEKGERKGVVNYLDDPKVGAPGSVTGMTKQESITFLLFTSYFLPFSICSKTSPKCTQNFLKN